MREGILPGHHGPCSYSQRYEPAMRDGCVCMCMFMFIFMCMCMCMCTMGEGCDDGEILRVGSDYAGRRRFAVGGGCG